MKKFISILIAFMLVVTIAMPILAGEFKIDDILVYKALPEYHEAPELHFAVAKGELPPIEQRLPKEPLVLKERFMSDGLGEYGGIWRDFVGAEIQGWNWGVGQSQGWYGVNDSVQEGLIDFAGMFLLEEPEVLPNLAKSWEWSKDGKELTMHLIEGAKWSDGVEFTADDVLFSYEDLTLNANVPSWYSESQFTMNGKVAELEKIDSYTIRWHFPIAYPLYIFYYMRGYAGFAISPKHVVAKYHPKYNPNATYRDLLDSLPPENLPAVTLGPWVPVKYKAGEGLLLRRNPYYWQVDESGKQLPYLSEFYYEIGTAALTRDLNVLGGTGDHTNLESKVVSKFLEEAQSPDARFRVEFGPYVQEFGLVLNLSLYKGVKTTKDKAMRELFRKIQFREAISRAIDRERIMNAILPGPLLKKCPGGIPSGSPFYDSESTVFYGYDPEKSKSLLRELGFKDTDNDDILNWPADSAWNGENLSIVCLVNSDLSTAIDIGEGLMILREVGIELKLKPILGPTWQAKTISAEFEMYIERNQQRVTPHVNLLVMGPIAADMPLWHQAGMEGERDLLPFEIRIQELLQQMKIEVSPEKRKEAFSEIQYLWTKNLYNIGIYEEKHGWAVAKRFKNVPENAPVYMYKWFAFNSLPQHWWVPKDKQLPEMAPGLIPTYE